MRDIIFGAGFLLIMVLPLIAIVWVIYRLAKGSSGGSETSIKGD